jgi:hypothetical protein
VQGGKQTPQRKEGRVGAWEHLVVNRRKTGIKFGHEASQLSPQTLVFVVDYSREPTGTVHVFSVNHFTLPDNANFVGGKRTIALSATSVLPFMTSPCIPTFLLEYGIPIAYHAATSIGSIRLTCDAHTALSKKPQNPSLTTQCLIGEYKGVSGYVGSLPPLYIIEKVRI